MSDCVIALDQRIQEEVSTRRLRLVKYRGSPHGTNEYPFLITHRGFMVLPITMVGLLYKASEERVSTGIEGLDRMLGGGIFRGSTLLVTGTVGTGKTTIVGHLIEAACRRGEKALLVSFEESPEQLVRNLRSVGIDLGPFLEAGLLRSGPSGRPPRGWRSIWAGWRACSTTFNPAWPPLIRWPPWPQSAASAR